LIGQPGSVLGNQLDGDSPGPPTPPAPPLAGTVIPQKNAATDPQPASRKQNDSQAVPTIAFKNSSDGQANVKSQAPAKDPEQIDEPQRDPLVELTARMVEDTDVVSADTEELAPASMESCDSYCCPPPRPLFWVAGVEASFLWPDANSDDAVFEFEDEFGNVDVSHSSHWDGVDTMNLTPRIWLGVQGCAWGANVRYWHLRACGGTADPTLDDDNDDWSHSNFNWGVAPDTGFFSDSQLDAYTVDLELTRRFCIGNCASQASLGVRHGSLQFSDSVTGLSLDDDARHMAFARSDSYSRGTGVVMGLYGRKPLFPCSCVHWFYNARWSALWGPTSTSAETFAAVMVDGSSAGSVNGASTYVDDTLIIGEIQVGLEWNYALQCLPANAFFRTAVEYQRWDGGPGSSEAGSFASYTDTSSYTSMTSVATSSASPQLDLVGITIGTGLTW
jgi:hypothetical protein